MGYPEKTGQQAWEYKTIPTLMGGINVSKRPDLLDDTETVQLKNVLMRAGLLTNDAGYKQIGQDISGTPQLEQRFPRQSKSIDIMLVTTKTVYEFNESFQRYHVVKGTNATTATGGPYSSGANAITVTSAAGFVSGDVVGFFVDGGDQHSTTVTVSGSTLNLDVPLPTGMSISTGNVVRRGVKLSGNLDIQVCATIVSSNDWFVFTNGVDIVKRYNGTDCVDVPGLPSGGNVVCQNVMYFNAALFLFNTTEGGTNFPWRARRSNAGDPTDWVTGTAGKDDLLETSNGITAVGLLGPYLVVYKNDCAYRGEFVGSSTINYLFTQMVTTDGCLSPQALAITETKHYIMGQTGFYEYSGGFNYKDIGYKIFDKVFGTKGNLSPIQRQKSFALYIPELGEIWFFYPSVASNNPDIVMRYIIENNIWYERKFNDVFQSAGLFQTLSIFTWVNLIGSWTNQTWLWSEQTVVSNSYAIHLLAAATGNKGRVMEYDYATLLDNGVPIRYTIETKDFLHSDVDCRFDMMEMMIQGTNVDVLYSTDKGKSWILLGIVNEPKVTKSRLFLQFPFQQVRFRWTGTNADLRLDWAAFSYKIESL